ncbi:MAG: tripartite tricarboxylate transporter substrate binding protein [Betaproteobacteria bacterium]|nr:tripartite tricarboxylate transporter substrate binding protein [Betaproteobacteria bacterium]
MKFLLPFLLFFAANSGFAQEYPAKGLRIVVPYAAGGGTDTVSRLMAARLSTIFNQPVVVENKPGASANIGTEFVARASADGYTILITAPNFTTSEALFDKLTWKFEDFVPVIHLVRYEQVLVASTQSQVTSIQAMIAQAKAKPGSLTYGTPGTASNSHLGIELLKQRADFGMQHVPYKGSGPLKNDLLGGHVPFACDGLGGQMDLIKSGKVKALAVLSPRRSAFAPDIPSLGEMGIKDVDATGWYGALVPAGTPPAVIARLHKEFAAALQLPEIRDRITGIGVEPVGGTSDEFRNYLLGERKKWAGVIRAAQIKAD